MILKYKKHKNIKSIKVLIPQYIECRLAGVLRCCANPHSCVSQFNSKFAQQILDTEHTCSPMDQTMEILHDEKKGQKLNTLKWFQTYNVTKKALQFLAYRLFI
jgi:hypothetical protein